MSVNIDYKNTIFLLPQFEVNNFNNLEPFSFNLKLLLKVTILILKDNANFDGFGLRKWENFK